MDRKKFKKRMKKLSNNEDFNHDLKTIMNNILCESLDRDNNLVFYSQNSLKGDDLHIVIAMEEMAELTKELSKALRRNPDEDGLLEEIADVLICIGYISKIFEFDDQDIKKALYVKLKNIEEHICDGSADSGDSYHD